MLEEESVFPGASDGTFLDRVQMYHGETDEKGLPVYIRVYALTHSLTPCHFRRAFGEGDEGRQPVCDLPLPADTACSLQRDQLGATGAGTRLLQGRGASAG